MAYLTVDELAILIVEPSHFQQKVIAQQLADAGCQKIDCVDGIEAAFEHARTYRPDLIISAMYMNDGTGVDLVTRLRSDEATHDIPFMLVSSETRPDFLEPVRQAGSVAILPKPFRHEDLERALNATLDFVDPEHLELESYDTETLRLLVVDDSDFALKHIARTLEAIGIRNIVTARDGAEAMRLLEQETFDLVFTDFNMPNMDGETLTREIRSHSPQPDVPVLMITSEQNHSRLEAVQHAGVNAICCKPFGPEQLKGLIRRLLG